MMWTSPISWYYPFLGSYPVDYTPDYFQRAILSELTSVTEWIFFVAIVVVTFTLYCIRALRDTFLDHDPFLRQKIRKFCVGLTGVALFVLALWIIIIAAWNPLYTF